MTVAAGRASAAGAHPLLTLQHREPSVSGAGRADTACTVTSGADCVWAWASPVFSLQDARIGAAAGVKANATARRENVLLKVTAPLPESFLHCTTNSGDSSRCEIDLHTFSNVCIGDADEPLDMSPAPHTVISARPQNACSSPPGQWRTRSRQDGSVYRESGGNRLRNHGSIVGGHPEFRTVELTTTPSRCRILLRRTNPGASGTSCRDGLIYILGRM